VTGMPCKHAVSAIIKAKQTPEHYVRNFIKKPMYAEAFKPVIYPVPEQHDWTKTNTPEYCRLNIIYILIFFLQKVFVFEFSEVQKRASMYPELQKYILLILPTIKLTELKKRSNKVHTLKHNNGHRLTMFTFRYDSNDIKERRWFFNLTNGCHT
jgi:hypothetical protein